MISKSLAGKTALVTGAPRRIGKAISLALAAEGVNIALHHNDPEADVEQLANDLADYKIRSWAIKADFSDPHEYETLVERARDIAGGLDILVNNASIFSAATLDTIDFKSLTQHIQINAWVPFVLSRDFARLAGRGQIINILDSKIKGYDCAHAPYILSKHMLAVLTRMCALSFAPHITVNGIAPGLILPPAGKDESYLDRLADTVPLKRHGGPDDIAGAVVYLLKNDFITGQVIYVDGGRHLAEYENGPYPH